MSESPPPATDLTTRTAADGAATDRIPRSVWRVAAVIVLGAFMAGLDTSLVNVGLDTIARQLRGTLTDAQWVTSGYLLALAAALPACPWLSRRIGPDRLWLAALVVFCGASLACALAPNLAVLIAARLVQGAGGGLLVPAGQAVLGRAAGAGRVGRVMSTSGIAVVLAPAISPAIGGLLITQLTWRWLFLINVPIGLLAFVLGLRLLPRQPTALDRALDPLGLALLSGGLPLFSYGVIEAGSRAAPAAAVPLTCMLGGAAAMVGFVVRALRRPRAGAGIRTNPPLLDLHLFGRSPYAAAQTTVLLTGASLFGGLIVLPLYYEVLRGESVITTGLLLLAYGGGAAAALRVGGRLTDRRGGGFSSVIGLAITVAATVPFVFLPANTDLVVVELLQLVRGVGVGMAGLPAMSSAFSAAGDQIEDATTTANILQRVGGSLGSALLVIVLQRDTGIAGFHAAFASLSGGAALALVAAAWLAVEQRREDRRALDVGDRAPRTSPSRRPTA